MAVSLYHSATEYIANPITLLRGAVSDITLVGIYVTTSAVTIPNVADFTTVTLVDGTKVPPDANSVVGEIDVLTLVGPRAGQLSTLTAGTYQVYILLKTAVEDIIRRVDTLSIL